MFLNCVGPLTVDFFQRRTLLVFMAHPRWLNPWMWGTVDWKVIVRGLTGGWSTLLTPTLSEDQQYLIRIFSLC